MFPPEVAIHIIENCSPKQWPLLAISLPTFRNVLLDDYFWKLQCRRNRLQEHSKQNFQRHYIINRNWTGGRYQRRVVETGGHVCLLLDGRENRILSAALPIDYDGAHLWDLHTGSRLFRVEPGICVAAIDGSILASGTRDGLLWVRDLRSKNIIRVVAHNGELSALALRGNTVVSGGSDGLLKVWDLRCVMRAESLQCETPISAVAISRDEQKVACGTIGGAIHLTGNETTYLPSAGAINCMAFHGKSLVIGTDNRHVHSLSDGKVGLNSHLIGNSAIVTFHKSGKRLVAGHADGLISIHHDVAKLDSPPTYINAGKSVVWQVYSDPSRLLSSSLDRPLLLHDFSS
jgi:WD40 repeat protein